MAIGSPGKMAIGSPGKMAIDSPGKMAPTAKRLFDARSEYLVHATVILVIQEYGY